MPPSRAGSGPPRRDYGGGSNNGNTYLQDQRKHLQLILIFVGEFAFMIHLNYF